MALNLQRTTSVSLAIDNPATRYLGNLTKVVQDTASYSGGGSAEAAIATSGTLSMFGLGTGHFIYVEYDKPMTLTLGTTAIALEVPAGASTGIFVATMAFSSAAVSGITGTANIGYVIAG